MKINQERINLISKSLGEKYLWKFIDSFNLQGEENLIEAKDKTLLWLPNHLSHFDYILLPFIFNSYGLRHPAIIAGNNLNRWPLNNLLSEGNGAIFINRKIMKSKKINEKKKKEILKLNSNLEDLIISNNSLINFVEAGRDYEGNVMQRGDSGILNRYLRFARKNGKEPFACNIAIKYAPRTIESQCLHVASFFKDKAELLYFLTDSYSFAKEYFSKKDKPRVFVNIGKPYSLRKFIKSRDHEGLLEFVKADVKRLYQEIN